jgi:hypothetical protein
MNDKTKLSIVAIIAIVVVSIGFMALNQKEKAPNEKNIEFKNEFMSGCMGEGNYAFCSCAYDEIVKSVGLDGILEIGLEYEYTGKLPEVANKAIVKCVDKFF